MMYSHLSQRVRDERISNIMWWIKLRKCKIILKWIKRERENLAAVICWPELRLQVSSQHMFHVLYKWWLNLNYKRICLTNRNHKHTICFSFITRWLHVSIAKIYWIFTIMHARKLNNTNPIQENLPELCDWKKKPFRS